MDLVLSAIEFNHDPAGGTADALNIRRNLDFEVPLPEYQRGRSHEAADSLVAYSIRDTHGQAVTISVTFTREGTSAAAYQLRAEGGGVLGPIGIIDLAFAPGETSTVALLPLDARTFDAVGRHDVTWAWRAREADAPGFWETLGTTHHRIYLLLSTPETPWSDAWGSPASPWTDLLDFVCPVAHGLSDDDSVARAVVRHVYSDLRLKYNIEDGSRRYFAIDYLLSQFIERVLRGKRSDAEFLPGCGDHAYWYDWTVNCMDCAGIVTLMGTVLGSPIECRSQSPFGYVKLIQPIGQPPCNNPFYGCHGRPIVGKNEKRSPFSFHAFAIRSGRYFDACLRAAPAWYVKALFWIAWAVVVTLSLGSVKLGWLLDRAQGWLIAIMPIEYRALVIGTNVAGATPVPGRPVRESVPFS